MFLSKRNWVGYIVATTIALYSHHFAIFALFVQGLWFTKEFFWGVRQTALSMLKAFIAVGVLYIPWLYPLYLQTTLVGGDFWLATPTLTDLWNLVRKFLAEGIPHKFGTAALYLFGAIFLLRRWGQDKEKAVFLLSWFLIPLALTWAVSQIFQSIFFDRYMLFAIPGAMLLLASARRRLSEAFLLFVGLLLVTISIFYFTHPTKRPFRELANYVKQERQEGDFLINHNAAAHHLWESIYYGVPAPLWIPEGDLPFYVGTALMREEDILRELPQAPRIGVISSGSIEELALPGYTRDSIRRFDSLSFAWYLPEKQKEGSSD